MTEQFLCAHRPRIERRAPGSWQMTCSGCDIQCYSANQSTLIGLAEAHLLQLIPIADDPVPVDVVERIMRAIEEPPC